MSEPDRAPPIGDYGLIGDCHSTALVSRSGSIDWCCLPRHDSGSCFGRLLDWERGGFCTVGFAGSEPQSQAYVEETLVLETVLSGAGTSMRVHDFFAMAYEGDAEERPPAPDGAATDGGAGKMPGDVPGEGREIVRIVHCLRGAGEVQLEIAPRFDYGAVRPWLRRVSADTFTAIGGDDGLIVWSDGTLAVERESLLATATLHAGQSFRVVIRFARPHLIEAEAQPRIDPHDVDAKLERTVAWWRDWRRRLRVEEPDDFDIVRSAVTLKALTYEPTGAIAAAATTSLPETPSGKRNWDYRFSWIRDSTLAAHAFAEVGCQAEAERFRHFIVRSSAGHAEDLQIMFGVGGERRLGEQELEMAGYRGAKPVRAGNDAARQLQLDAFGELLNLGWRWHRRGRSPDDDEWRFFAELVEAAIQQWREPDRGIWEWRGKPRHFVHSKAACWAAVDHGIELAQECLRKAPVRRWKAAAAEIREEIERRGYDSKRGVFLQCFDERHLDCALLLLPVLGFVAWDDERMVRTTDALAEELAEGPFLRRYTRPDELPGKEGCFLACSFWLAECYARQGRVERARDVFDRAMTAANHVGLLSEEVDPDSGEMLGNVPQALSHLSQISAAVAISQASEALAERKDGIAAEVLASGMGARETT